jgi:hypothetical protein
MADKNKPLPKPPSRPSGKSRPFGEQEEPTLLADRIARAVAEGRMEELMGTEIPDNEQARKLVSMMMGMTGMSLPPDFEPAAGKQGGQNGPETGRGAAPEAPPEDIIKATRGGDVEGLKKLLRKEHAARSGRGEEKSAQEAPAAPPADLSSNEKEVIDHLIAIAKDNGVTMDWLILRALKVYVQEYDRTGRL